MTLQSPYEAHFGTNSVPSDAEISDVKRLMAGAEPNIDMYNAQIEEIKRRLEACTQFIACHRTIIAPMKRIPDDILFKIFMLCLPEDGLRGMMRSFEAPLLLSHVCRHWRTLTLDAAIMWSSLYLYFPEFPSREIGPSLEALRNGLLEGDSDSDEEDRPSPEVLFDRARQAWSKAMEGQLNLASLWLSRSKPCPLSINVVEQPRLLRAAAVGSSRHPDPDSCPVTRLLGLVQGHSERWESLALVGLNSGSTLEDLYCLSSSQIPHLQSLVLRWHSSTPLEGVNEPHIPIVAAGESARLRALCLDNFSFTIDQFGIHWSTLTELSLCRTQGRAFNLNTETTRNSEPLFGPGPISTHSERGPATALARPHDLRELQDFDRPLLQVTKRPFNPIINLGGPHSSAAFMEAWGHQIISLEFGGIDVTVEELVACVKLTPAVKYLTLDLTRLQTPVQDPPTSLDELLANPPAAVQHLQNVDEAQILPLLFQLRESRRGRFGLGRSDFLRSFSSAPTTNKSQWLSSLTLTPGSERICPDLQALRFTVSSPSEMDVETLHAFVQSRRSTSNTSTLRRVTARFGKQGYTTPYSGREGLTVPKRCTDEVLNASFKGEKVIHTEWHRDEVEESERSHSVSPLSELEVPTDEVHARIPFQSPWAIESRHYM